MNTLDILSQLAATSSRTDKEQIIFNAFMGGNTEFFIGAQMAYDSLVSFGIAKVAEIAEEDDEPGTLSFDDFRDLAGKLSRRELTGHAARDAIHEAALNCHAATWNNFYRRVLLRDLKVGVETSTINKVLKKVSQAHPHAFDLMVPVFGCQLAKDGGDPQHAKKLAGVKMVDVKLDGVRLLSILDKEAGTVTQYSRNGLVIDTFTEVREALEKLLPEIPFSIVLDGEIVATSFQELMTQLTRKVGKNTSTAKLALFDIIPLEDFKKGVCTKPQSERHEILASLSTSGLLGLTEGKAYVVPKVTIDLDTPEGQAAFKEFNLAAIEAGYEGIMIKDPTAPYEIKRSAAWLKLKPFIEVSLTVTGLQEGEPDGKYKGSLGALICEGEDDGKKIKVNVGSGISDAERSSWWAKPSIVVGMVAEIRADAITRSQDGEFWSLRFPRLKGWRGRSAGEKL